MTSHPFRMRRTLVQASAASLVLAATATCQTNAADVAAGKTAFVRQCALCHTIDKDGPNRYGPNLFGIVGRKAGSIQNFKYSPEFKSAASWDWNEEALEGWISSPRAMLPGTTMGVFQGVADRDRSDIIAYLASQK